MRKPKKFSGGGNLTMGDRLAMQRAGLPLNEDTRAADLAAYQARQEAAEKRAAARRAAPPTPRPKPEPPKGSVVGARAGMKDAERKAGFTPSTTRTTAPERTGLSALLFGTGRPKIDIRPVAGATTPTGLAVPGYGLTAGEEYPEQRRKGGKVKKMATGGRARSYKDMDAGAGGGMGRIEKTAIAKAGKKIAMKYKKGGEIASDADYTSNPMLDSGYKELGEKSKKKMGYGGAAKYAKGGKVEKFEGSAKDMAEDKRLAKKYGMSLKKWEASSMDKKHDTQKSAKGLKKGGEAAHDKGCKCMMCGGKVKYAKGGMSTAQDGKKAPLRARPTAMAKGGKVTFGDKPLPGTKTKSNPGTVLTGASLKPQGFKAGKAKASGAKPSGMMAPLKQTKMASGGKVRGTGIAQRGTKFIGEV